MSQIWTDNPFESGHVGQVDLQNIENNFLTLKSLFSGGSAPANAVAGMPWFDTTKKLLKIRNQANNAWIGVLYGNASLKLWLYLNSAQDGWAIDSSVSDRVLALKGGSTYTTGGAVAGSWTITGLTAANHWHDLSNHTHSGTTSGPSATENVNYGVDTQRPHVNHTHTITTGGPSINGTGWQTDNSVSSTGAWRVAAAVGTMQYPDV